MSEFNNLKLEVADEIAVLTISRPAALNALNSETLDELNVALTEIEARDDVKVLILTGGPDKKDNAFKSFVAGADISEMVNFTAAEARAFGMRASVPFFKLMNMRQVTICAVNGFALGGVPAYGSLPNSVQPQRHLGAQQSIPLRHGGVLPLLLR